MARARARGKATTGRAASRPASSRAPKVFTVPELVVSASGRKVKNAQLVPTYTPSGRRTTERSYYVRDARGRQLKDVNGNPLIATRRDQEKAVTAAQHGGALRSLEQTARVRRAERGTGMVRRALQSLASGEPNPTMELARRRQAYDASRGITRSIDEILADPQFHQDIAALNQKPRKRRRGDATAPTLSARSAKARALVRFGMRRETDEFRVGESPKAHSTTVLAELARAGER